MQNPRSSRFLEIDERVRARNQSWRVQRRRPFAGGLAATLVPDGTAPATAVTLLSPFDEIVAAPIRLRSASRAVAARVGLGALAAARPAGSVWSGVAGRFDLLPWQFEPALCVLDGATRLLLADEVGLGKTLQALLIVGELRARGVASRALVLTPPALRHAWHAELSRLHLDGTIVDRHVLSTLAPHEVHHPWHRSDVVISSIDLVKRPETRAAVEAAAFDVLIVDEAHHATAHSDRGATVSRLARLTPWVVLVSATPHDGTAAAFQHLLGIGAHNVPDEDPMRVWRRRHVDAAIRSRCRQRVCRIAPGPAERALHDALTAYAGDLRGDGQVADDASSPPAHHLLASFLCRRAASAPVAVALTLSRRLDALSGHAHDVTDTQPPLPWHEVDDADDGAGPWLAARGPMPLADELPRLESLRALATAAIPAWRKGRWIRRWLARVAEPVVIFTEFRDTLLHLHQAIAGEHRVAVLHGGLDVHERGRELRRFLEGDARVLLATDVAGEGLNLQMRARAVMTIEWPWSPLRMTQRVGRGHRLGQRRDVHASHLTLSGSFEEHVRVRAGHRAADASAALMAITGTSTRGEAGTAADADDRARVVTGDLARRRAWMARAGTLDGTPAWCLPARAAYADRTLTDAEPNCRHTPSVHADRSNAVALLAVVSAHVPTGRLLWTRAIALRVEVNARRRSRSDWRRLCLWLARHDRIDRAAREAARPLFDEARWDNVRRRLCRIGAHVASTRQPAVQASLFDRRAVKTAARRDAVREALHAHVDRHLHALDDGAARLSVDVHLVLPLREVKPATARRAPGQPTPAAEWHR